MLARSVRACACAVHMMRYEAIWCYGTRITPQTIKLKKQYCIRHVYSNSLASLTIILPLTPFCELLVCSILYHTSIKNQLFSANGFRFSLHPYISVCVLSLTSRMHCCCFLFVSTVMLKKFIQYVELVV